MDVDDYGMEDETSIPRVEEVVEDSGPGGSGDILQGFPKATGTPPTVVREESEAKEEEESEEG
ncbi:MAG TPA: hypothetical protein DEP84_16755 [Chloroflexi bacterium]|nr:hypothetical protein [Chloroflexota bacterium]